MKLTMLGTGNAVVTACYNTCFVLQEGGRYFLVDGGGGNTLLLRLKQADIDWRQIRTVFVTHKHMDHILGILWMMRLICQGMARGEYEGDAVIYGHREVIGLLEDMAGKLLHEKQTQFIGRRLHLVAVEDGEQQRILGRPVTFFDIGSTKDRQFGFSMELGEGKRLTCCGDEPYHDCEERYVRGSDWLLHEAFCLSSQADVFRPYEKHHSTVADACRLAQSMGVKNLVLYHSPSKTFNVAGLQPANIIIPDEALRRKYRKANAAAGYSQGSIMGQVAVKSCYTKGDEWVKELVDYIAGNIAYVRDFVKKNFPKATFVEPEGTYLVWIDFSGYGFTDEELEHLITDEAKLWLDSGKIFGPATAQFERFNMACPRSVVEKAFNQLKAALDNHVQG